MTYDAMEESTNSGSPIELYAFTKGASSWNYTSSDVAYSGYSAVSIRRSDINQDNEDNGGGIEVTLPASDAIAKLWTGSVSCDPLWLTITRLHRVDASTVTIFIGRCINVKIGDVEATLSFQSLKQSWRRKIPTQIASPTCRHMLYSTGKCGLTKSAYSSTVSVSAISGNTVTISTGLASGAYIGGEISYGSERRMIIGQLGSGNILLLFSPLPGISVGSTVTVAWGCDRSFTTCNTRFSNTDRFGGLTVYCPAGSNPFIRGIY